MDLDVAHQVFQIQTVEDVLMKAPNYVVMMDEYVQMVFALIFQQEVNAVVSLCEHKNTHTAQREDIVRIKEEKLLVF